MTARTIEEIFSDRTCHNFSDKSIPLILLQEIYDLMKLGPTSANCSPLRIIFEQSKAQKENLVECAMEGNKSKIMEAPVTALFGYDTKFYDKMDKLFPHNTTMKDFFKSDEAKAYDTMTRNATLQAAYFMIIARAKGLGCGPMSGFDVEKLNKVFFKTNSLVNFICTLGYRRIQEEHPRLPRLNFDEVCTII